MTDATHPDDELISAYLDGEATEAEAARVRSSSELMARADQLARAAALTAIEVEPLSASSIDSLISRAVDAGAESGNIVDLSAVRRRRRLPGTIIAVAAGVVALALAVPAIRAINFDSGSSSNSAAAPMVSSSGDAPADQKSLSPSAATTATTTASASAAAPADFATPDTGSITESALDSTTTSGGVTELTPVPALSTSWSITQLPAPDPTAFDPLPDVLPTMMDIASLGEYIMIEFSLGGDVARATYDQFTPVDIPPRCALVVGNYLDGPPPNLNLSAALLATDTAQVTVDGSSQLVILIRDAAHHAVALVVDLPGCTAVTPLEIDP